MRNETARKLLKETPTSVREQITKLGKVMVIEKILDDAYKLYMPQIRSEIESLTRFVFDHRQQKFQATHVDERLSYNILEIGTKFGGTFHIWNSINMGGPYADCLNISIDMSDGGKHGGISEEDMDKRDLWFCERFNNCHFIRGNSHDLSTHFKIFKLLEKWKTSDQVGSIEGTVDFLFIDGDHTYEGVKQDFEMYSPFVKPGGIIAFHDIVDSERHRSRDVYVAKFWNEIKNDYEHHEFVEEGNDWGGIGLIIKK